MIAKTYGARMGYIGCGVSAHVDKERITKIEGDPDIYLRILVSLSPGVRGSLTDSMSCDIDRHRR
jgi:hypothetical protein